MIWGHKDMFFNNARYIFHTKYAINIFQSMVIKKLKYEKKPLQRQNVNSDWTLASCLQQSYLE